MSSGSRLTHRRSIILILAGSEDLGRLVDAMILSGQFLEEAGVDLKALAKSRRSSKEVETGIQGVFEAGCLMVRNLFEAWVERKHPQREIRSAFEKVHTYVERLILESERTFLSESVGDLAAIKRALFKTWESEGRGRLKGITDVANFSVSRGLAGSLPKRRAWRPEPSVIAQDPVFNTSFLTNDEAACWVIDRSPSRLKARLSLKRPQRDTERTSQKRAEFAIQARDAQLVGYGFWPETGWDDLYPEEWLALESDLRSQPLVRIVAMGILLKAFPPRPLSRSREQSAVIKRVSESKLHSFLLSQRFNHSKKHDLMAAAVAKFSGFAIPRDMFDGIVAGWFRRGRPTKILQ